MSDMLETPVTWSSAVNHMAMYIMTVHEHVFVKRTLLRAWVSILSDGEMKFQPLTWFWDMSISGLLRVFRWLLGSNLRWPKQSLAEVEHWCVGLG